MRVADVAEKLNRWLPPSWAEDWDNVGLLVGAPDWPVRNPRVLLDVTLRALERAVAEGSTLLVSHHPPLFAPLRRLDFSTSTMVVAAKALEAKIALMAAHTNWDAAPDGVNVCLARSLELGGVVPLKEGPADSWGLGALGCLPESLDTQRFLDRLCRRWNLSWVHHYGPEKDVRSVALCGGSGFDLATAAAEGGADLFVTADVKYHQIEATLARGLNLVVVDHGEMERVSLPSLARGLSSRLDCPVAVCDDAAVPAPLGAKPFSL